MEMVKLKKHKGVFYKSAQEALAEVKQYLCIMYGTLIRFYSSIVKVEVLESMKEDFIEVITNLVFNEPMMQVVSSICRMCTKDEERSFALKFEELAEIKPSLIGLSKFFTLDETSEIRKVFKEQNGEAHIKS
jgi:hypothetical protein